MTPLEVVLEHYAFPFDSILPHQIETVNELAPKWNSGHWLDVGTGKTFTSTAAALFHKITLGHKAVVIMPPVLIKQWYRWLQSIRCLTGPELSVTAYRGTPKKRAGLNLDVDFLLVGVQMFNREYPKFVQFYRSLGYTVIVDEATIVAGIESDQHEKVYDFSVGHPVIPLSGTPIGNPLHGYAMTKFSAPGTYRNYQHFLNTHVAEHDFFGRPSTYKELEVLNANMLKNSKRVLFEDVYKSTEAPLFIKLDYELEPKHYKLYEKLAEEQLLVLPDGGKIDATTANRLMHALGQIVINQGHFSGVKGDKSNATELVHEKLEELGDKKLVVFTFYQLSSQHIVETFAKSHGAVAIHGGVSAAQKDKARDKFVNDPDCRMIVIQQRSGGYGLDGLQHVCHHGIFIEPCEQSDTFTQCVGRLKRTGQKRRVVVWLPVAEGTLQVRRFNNLLKSDGLVNQVIRNAYDLRQAIFGH